MATAETETIDAILRGERDRYGELIERHQKMVYGIAWSHLGDAGLAEDAAQEAFVKAFRYLATLRDPSKFSGWLAHIARNISISLSRTRRRELNLIKRWETEPAATDALPEAETGPNESLQDQLRQAMSQVPAIHRETLTLFYIEGKNVRDVATALDISESAVKTRLHRARTALRQELERRLAENLEGLRPGTGLRGSVMAVLPAAPIGAGAGGAITLLGKATAVLSKSFASVAMYLWIICIQILPFAILMSWFSRSQARNYSDSAEHAFRKDFVRRHAFTVILMAAAIGIAVIMLNRWFERRMLFQLLSVYTLWGLWVSLRFLRVNRSPFAQAQVFGSAMLFASFIAIGFFDFHFTTFIAAMLLFNIALYSANRHAPQRMDYNLFLRCATGGLMPVGSASPPESRPTATSDMRAFARFLGELWLIRDYSVREDRLLMKLPPVRSTVGNMLAGRGISYGSNIVLNADGTCQARMGSADHAAINRVEGRVMDTQDVARTVERTVAHACDLFMAGNTDAARSVLCAYSDKEVFKNESDKTKTYRRVAIISIASGIIALIGFLSMGRFLP